MAAKKTTRTASRSTSARPSKQAAASKEASTSASGDLPTPPPEPTLLPTTSAEVLGDSLTWAQEALSRGAQACLLVTGATVASITVKLPEGKRLQSLPPGDILVVVLPPGTGREPGIHLIEAALPA